MVVGGLLVLLFVGGFTSQRTMLVLFLRYSEGFLRRFSVFRGKLTHRPPKINQDSNSSQMALKQRPPRGRPGDFAVRMWVLGWPLEISLVLAFF